ncbi:MULTISPECIES: DsbA family oxidoreductase [Acinetobacter]|jgi:predicted DsbA family dithiol-disulfide isomerase|nr:MULTISPECIES: DsbA family oxidoreductase [Acinetobacter]MCS3528590.1 putative DsbA family dithiol-disulfide isomerase [Acinetobacter johnsonii]MDH1518595.1 DsbA family oxidoreductase [Acinetobacter johnsonii]OOW10672.1 dithiol-disulfide isomerase [Acinetobacter sp. MF4640]UIP94771.1 DsbA family oxidoreductase [Acinetobacter johnsonii]UNT43543.1 DsbA family oxidoreductase [Acinetobacter sp. LUNF3]
MRVDIWSDVVCPFCYIGKKRLEAAAEQAGVELEVHWHSFELDPDAPVRQEISNSERLALKYGRTVAEVEEMQRNIAKMAAEEGIEFNWENANSGNSFNAHRIIHLAQSHGLGNEAEEAFFFSYMTQGLPIGERETIEDVASRIGLNPVEVDDVLDSDEYADFVKFDQEVAREQLKVTGVPFFVFDQRVALAGAQPREVFLQVLEKAQMPTEENNAAQCSDESCETPKQS